MIPTRSLPPPINTSFFCKNTDAPQAGLGARIRSGLDHMLRWRRKQVFAWSSPFGSWLSSLSGTRTRWRWRCHTGTSASYLEALVVMATQDHDHGIINPYSYMSLTEVGVGSTTGRQYFGAAAAGALVDSMNTCGVFRIRMAVTPDADYECALVDLDGGRLVAACVYEVSNYGQYGTARAPAAMSPITSAFRSSVMPALTEAWKNNAAHLFNWTVDNQGTPLARTSTIDLNIIDGSSTTVSAATPGPTLDLTYCNTAVGGDVPCVFAAYGSATGGARAGEVYIKNSAGTVLATVSMTNGSAAQWWTTNVSLPASEAKYDFHVAASETGSGTTTANVGAVSLYQYLA